MDQEFQADAGEVARRLAARIGELELDLAAVRTHASALAAEVARLRAERAQGEQAPPPPFVKAGVTNGALAPTESTATGG
jgi:hypothetical protein